MYVQRHAYVEENAHQYRCYAQGHKQCPIGIHTHYERSHHGHQQYHKQHESYFFVVFEQRVAYQPQEEKQGGKCYDGE